jgi:cytochrome c peroxidase
MVRWTRVSRATAREFASNRARQIVVIALGSTLAGVLVACVHKSDPMALASASGVNHQPTQLVRPPHQPLSYVARLGRDLFFDERLSQSGKSSCATCHAPERAYAAPVNADTASRPVPSLRYLERIPRFHIGPDAGDVDDSPTLALTNPSARVGPGTRSEKVAGTASNAAALTPNGGLFWDGRETTLQAQAMVPLFNPSEMGNTRVASLAARMRKLYGARLVELFGAETVEPDDRLLEEATFTITRFELEDPSFHPYDSKYDAFLEGRATLTQAEAHGLQLFESPQKGNCAACHLDRPTAEGVPPAFSDFEYEALGVPRNTRSHASDSAWHDLGACGPTRTDLKAEKQYCGMFRTPTLRNVATRNVFFHNGNARTLDEVLQFYVFRDVQPEKVYPRAADGSIDKFDDLPRQYRANIDTTDAPFDRKLGQAPVLTTQEMSDIVAFLHMLNDGYRGDSARVTAQSIVQTPRPRK